LTAVPSADAPRDTERCPHRPECPGCPWLERPYGDQLRDKAAAVEAALRPYDVLAGVTVAACVGAERRSEYRTRTKWAVDGASIGLYGPDHVVVDTPDCRVVPAATRALADALRRRPPERGPARLGALDIRCTAAGETAVTLVIDAAHPDDARRHAEELTRWLRSAAAAALPRGVAWSFRRTGAPTTLGGPPEPLAGEPTVWDRVGRVATPFPPGSFSQAHSDQAAGLQRLVAEALERLPTGDAARAHVVDLYAGTGGLGLSLAARVAALTLVESYGPAAEAARRAAERLGVAASVRATTVDDALQALRGELRRPLVIVADPPRTGLMAGVLRQLVRLAPDLLVYVSCAPATLARDLAVLATYGWAATSVTPVDLMPLTDQVEAVAALRPGPPPTPRVVAEVPGEYLVLDKPPFLPTVPHPEWPDSLLARARRRDPAWQPAHRLDVGTSGLVLFRHAQSRRDPLEGAEKTYLAWVKGITHKSGVIDRPLEEDGRRREARTRYRRRAVKAGHSLVEIRLETGRTHQIRRHFAMIGHPVLGDERYGDPATNRYMAATRGLIRPWLHASRLALPGSPPHESPLPPDLA
jgi:23S rRNA (uracil1939-C5)-methyltransferase